MYHPAPVIPSLLTVADLSVSPESDPMADTLTGSVAIGANRLVLDHILLPHVEVAIWTRQPPSSVQDALLHWAQSASGPVQWRWPAPSTAWTALLAQLPAAVATWLEQDVQRLVLDMARWSQRRQLTVSLGPIAHDHCTRFHIDWLHMRLLCTYVGAGTQWIADADVRREALQLPLGPEGRQPGLLEPHGVVQQAAAGQVLVAKGHGHPHQLGGWVHRSPRVEDPSHPRVVLVVSAMAKEAL